MLFSSSFYKVELEQSAQNKIILSFAEQNY